MKLFKTKEEYVPCISANINYMYGLVHAVNYRYVLEG